MLYTNEGTLYAEDCTLRRIARSKVRAAVIEMELKTAALIRLLVPKINAHWCRKFTADEMLAMISDHPRLQPERTTIDRYTDAYPELKESVGRAYDRLNRKTLRQLEDALEPFIYQRRFAHTKGLHH